MDVAPGNQLIRTRETAEGDGISEEKESQVEKNVFLQSLFSIIALD